MKEISIEEKAKAYDKLLGKAKQIYNKENDVLIIHTLEDLFPELKESEDERIRRELIEFTKTRGGFKQEWITWLEKQGETVWSEETDDDAWMNDIISKAENNLQLNKAEIDWLKSLKPQNTWKPSDEQMEALFVLLPTVCNGNPAFSLYNDLKKLKGE